MRMKIVYVLIFLLTFPAVTPAQFIVGGLVDVEFRKGQPDSSPLINQTPNGKMNMYTPAIRVFGLGVISENWFAEAALQADYYGGESLSPVFFSLLNVNWLPIDDSNLMISAGRFVNPYGLQSERVLSSENRFVHLPLSHSWNLGIDKTAGVFSGDVDYSENGRHGQSMIYQRMYSQGIKLSNHTANDRLFYELAVTLAAASSHFEVGNHNRPAFIGRLAYKPFIWARLASSASYGPYMKRTAGNAHISSDELQSFNQLLYGFDLTLSHLYYSLIADVNFSRWNSPEYVYEGITFSDPVAEVSHYGIEFHIQLPFLPGMYTAVRGEILRPEKIRQDDTTTGTYYYFRFGPEANRAETVLGYRVNRDITAKASYQVNSTSPNTIRANVMALQLSVGF